MKTVIKNEKSEWRSLKIPNLEKITERGDFIQCIEPQKVWEKNDRDDLFVWDDRNIIRHKKKTEKDYMQERQKKYSFTYRSIEARKKS